VTANDSFPCNCEVHPRDRPVRATSSSLKKQFGKIEKRSACCSSQAP
jgi:hypothetical protein